MGLDINVRKPIKFLGTETPKDFDDWTYIYSLDFSPIKHLTKFETGYWEAEYFYEPHFYMTYGGFSHNFRHEICMAMYGKGYKATIEAIDKGEIVFNAPFAEMLYFADNEGCFDYVVAEKLLKDFRDNKEKLWSMLDKYLQGKYNDYIAILEKCAEVKGVVDYH